MKKLFLLMAMAAIGVMAYAQGPVKFEKADRDPVTFEPIKIPKEHPNDILKKTGILIPSTPYIDVNGTRYYFSEATWAVIKDDVTSGVENIIRREKRKSVNENSRVSEAEAYRAAMKAKRLKERNKIINEINRIDGMSGDEIP